MWAVYSTELCSVATIHGGFGQALGVRISLSVQCCTKWIVASGSKSGVVVASGITETNLESIVTTSGSHTGHMRTVAVGYKEEVGHPHNIDGHSVSAVNRNCSNTGFRFHS